MTHHNRASKQETSVALTATLNKHARSVVLLLRDRIFCVVAASSRLILSPQLPALAHARKGHRTRDENEEMNEDRQKRTTKNRCAHLDVVHRATRRLYEEWHLNQPYPIISADRNTTNQRAMGDKRKAKRG